MTKPTGRPKGRPKNANNVFTKDMKAQLIGAVKVTGFLKIACDYIGVTPEGVRSAANRDPDFKIALKQAKAMRKIHSLTMINKSQKWQAHAWFLERTDPENFGRSQTLRHTGHDGGAVKTELTVHRTDFSEIPLAELLELKKKVEKKLKKEAEQQQFKAHRGDGLANRN